MNFNLFIVKTLFQEYEKLIWDKNNDSITIDDSSDEKLNNDISNNEIVVNEQVRSKSGLLNQINRIFQKSKKKWLKKSMKIKQIKGIYLKII